MAADYRKATGKPLGISAEIARHDVARLLGLQLIPPQETHGYDAIGDGRWEGKRIQIKGRAIFDESKSGHRIGQLRINQEWDSVMLVLMDQEFEPYEIHEVERDDLMEVLADKKGGKRSKRGVISVARFKIISRLVWTRENGIEV